MAPRSGLEVIGAMRRTYPSRELRSLSFTVYSASPGDTSDGPSALVYARLPGRFRETLLPARQKSGSVRDRQRLAFFEKGKRTGFVRRIDLATLLAFDLFAQSIDSTIVQLDSARVRFGLVREDRLGRRPVWVVGAMPGDTTTAQFWVDAERWVVLRVIQPDLRSPARMTDIRFSRYEDYLGVPVPGAIEVYRAGRLVERRVMKDIVTNRVISGRAFDVAVWRDVR